MKNMLEALVCGCLGFFTLRFDAQIGLKILHYEYFGITTDSYNEKAALSWVISVFPDDTLVFFDSNRAATGKAVSF